MGGRGLRIVLRRHEANEVRERFFPKESAHRRAVVGHAPALEEFEVIDGAPLISRGRTGAS
jgi:hypothetical protein